MSNTKSVRIVADVPFYWLTDEVMSDKDAAHVARLFLGPSMGLKMESRFLEYQPNEHGGKTAMYRVTMTGTEAFHTEPLMRILRSAGTVQEASYIDLDDGNREYNLNHTGGFSQTCQI